VRISPKALRGKLRKHNLKARAIASLKGELSSFGADVASLIKDPEKSVIEANSFIRAPQQQQPQTNRMTRPILPPWLRFTLPVIALLIVLGHSASAQPPGSAVQELLRSLIESGGIPLKLVVSAEPIYAVDALPEFYERRGFQPAWSEDQGPLPQAYALIRAIHAVEREGLRPSDYHLAEIETILNEIRHNQEIGAPLDPQRIVDLDLLMTDAFLICGTHLVAGKVNPQSILAQWFTERHKADMLQILEEAIGSNQVEQALDALPPAHPHYVLLRQALARYREIARSGGWPRLAPGKTMHKGDRDDRILLLRRRLAIEGFLPADVKTAASEMDDDLTRALRRFQQLNGLDPDGVLGLQSLAALNRSVDERIDEIVVNLERWRWLPRNLGSRYILVNIASYRLEVKESDRLIMDMRVVVGRSYHQTPVFSDKVTYMVLNPSWTVPDMIARQEILPKVKKDPNYLADQKIRVFEGWGAGTKEIDPSQVDWARLSATDLPYRFRQDPGPQNALGRIKFMFPNPYDVYLHDTPAKELFGKTRRDFSHGCIRVEKPLDLAAYLMQNHAIWSREALTAALSDPKAVERTVQLPEPVPIHILYWTVWTDSDGDLNFSPDIYERDEPLHRALLEAPPKKP
jgi:murein L,D-transpeptidase YcbB/YkuD